MSLPVTAASTEEAAAAPAVGETATRQPFPKRAKRGEDKRATTQTEALLPEEQKALVGVQQALNAISERIEEVEAAPEGTALWSASSQGDDETQEPKSPQREEPCSPPRTMARRTGVFCCPVPPPLPVFFSFV